MKQAQLVQSALCRAHGWLDAAVEIVVITTSGDKNRNQPLAEIGGKGLFIKELEAAVRELHECAACGKPIAADAATCPHCGTPVGEAAELHEKATESLNDLEKQLADPGPEASLPQPPAPGPVSQGGLESAAEVVAAVEVTESAPASVVQVAEIAPEPAPAAEPEPGESEGLEGFIEDIEAEVGPGWEESATEPPRMRMSWGASMPAAGSMRWPPRIRSSFMR